MRMECPKCHSSNPNDTHFCSMCATRLDESGKTVASSVDVDQTSRGQLKSGVLFAGRYRIIEELGKGGMGKVYKAWDMELEEKMALKLLNPQTGADEKAIERFRNELKLARQISHRNICRMYDLGNEEEIYYITMEYIPGEDLKSSIRRMGPLSAGKAIYIAKQVCRGLTEAHRLGVIHRDLKPQNIMIDKQGNARIMDFGIARSLKTKGITETGVIIGTPQYMSVEQVEGKEVDQRSDIYSLGVILYEMVTGAVPFDGDTPLSIAVKHTTTEPPDPRELNNQIPEGLSQVILRSMNKDRGKRYESAEELLAELSMLEKGMSTAVLERSTDQSAISREITVSFSPRRVLIPFVILSLALVAGLAIWQTLSREPVVTASPVIPSLAILPFENNSEDSNVDCWRMGLSELITADLRQSRHLRVLSEERVLRLLCNLGLSEKGDYVPADLKKLATKGWVDHVLTGSFSVTGQNLVMTATVQSPHAGLVVSSRRMECSPKEGVFDKIDELTKRIKSDLGLLPEQISKDIDRRAADIVTGSTEAYEYYIQGRINYLNGGSPDRTIELMGKALALDPEFALTHRMMAAAYGELDLITESWHSLRKASGLKHRLSLRDHQLVQGELYSMSEETYKRAIEAYNRLLEAYPEDSDANFNLGFLLYSDLERWREAVDRFEALVQNKPETPEPYIYQAEAYMAMGRYDSAGAVLEQCLTNFPAEAWLHERISAVHLYQNRLNLALQEAQKSLSLDPFSVRPSFLGDIYHCRGDWSKAETLYQEALRTEGAAGQYDLRLRLAALYLSQGQFDNTMAQLKQASALAERLGDAKRKMRSHLYLARLNLSAGRWDDALEEWRSAWRITSEEGLDPLSVLHLGGLIHLRMNSTVEAERLAAELKKTIQAKSNQKLMRYHHHLTGMIELEKGNISEAMSHFQTALSLLPFQHSESDDHAQFVYPLAVAFYRAGDLEKAQEQFKRLTSLTEGRLFFGDMFAKSFYWLGRIYQEKGWEEEAERHYSKFLQILAKHDLGMPELKDAESRFAQLESGT